MMSKAINTTTTITAAATTTKLRSRYPAAFKACLPEALKYGKCVVQSLDLKVNECENEFRQLDRCFQDAMIKQKA